MNVVNQCCHTAASEQIHGSDESLIKCRRVLSQRAEAEEYEYLSSYRAAMRKIL